MLRLPLCLPLLVALGCCMLVQATIPFTTASKWDKNVHIPYILDDRYNETQKATFHRVLKTFNENTCLNFTEDAGPGLKLEYFYANGGVCKSSIGDSRDEKNNANHRIFIHDGCITTYGIQHETIHALGFRHTQTRPDRDDYITVHYENVLKSEKTNFDKLLSNNTILYDIPYEFNSLMHYGATDEYDRPIISALDTDYNMTLGGDEMIFNDWKMINLYYKCNESCPDKIECHNGGYQNSRNCSQCVCPRFYSGARCDEELNLITLTVGDNYPLNYGWHYNQSMYYDKNNQIRIHPKESYERSPLRVIKAPEGTKINVSIDYLQHRDMHFFDCKARALEIVDGDLTMVGKRFCLRTRQTGVHSFVSKTNVIGWLMYAKPGLDLVANITLSVV